MTYFVRDVQVAIRALSRDLRISLVGALGLALGIGLTAAMFSIVYGAVLRGLPFEDSGSLMHLEQENPEAGSRDQEVSIHDYVAWKERQSSFDGLAAFYTGTVNVTGDDATPERFEGAFISANAFDILGIKPIEGRGFTTADEDPGAPSVMLLGHRTWTRRFDSDPGIVGQVLRANGEQVTVIGIMPEGFRFPLFQDVWMPLRMDPLRIERGEGQTLEVFGRLAAGSSVEKARSDLGRISQQLEAEFPDTNAGLRPVIKPYITEMLSAQVVTLLYTMLIAVFGVLLIACANVANLLMARAAMHSHDIAIRSALGASRKHLAGIFLAEALVLSLVGAVIGLGFAQLGIYLFNSSIQHLTLPFWIDIKLDLVAVIFVLGLTLFASIAAGLGPGFRASGGELGAFLKEGTRGNTSLKMGRFSRALVVAEIALSCGLLIAAGLMIKSVANLRSFDFDFQVDNVLTAQISLPEREYEDDVSRDQFFPLLRQQLQSQGTLQEVGFISVPPVVGASKQRFSLPGKTYAKRTDQPYAARIVVGPGALEVLGVAAIEGRLIEDGDTRDSQPVALVNQSFQRRFFPQGNVIGEQIRMGVVPTENPWRTIVGVIPDTLVDTIASVEQEGVFIPLSQSSSSTMTVLARTRTEPLQETSTLRRAVAEIDSNLPVYGAASMEQVIENNTWFYGVFGGLFMVFGLVALVLAIVGLYGVMAFSVSRRRREIALRMALGAEAKRVIQMIVGQGMRQMLWGLAFGLLLAAVLGRGLGFILFEVNPFSPLVYILVITALLVTGVATCLLSSIEVIRVQPIIALRTD